MPLITTHNFFAGEVLKQTKPIINKIITEKQHIYELFAQGFDPLFFYEILPFHKKIGNFCHTHYTDTFFLNFIHLIKQTNLQHHPDVMAALFGHLTHYTLDSTCHPFIIYKTGEYKKTKPETLKYNGLHTKMEMQIDAYIYEKKTNLKFYRFKIHKQLIPKEKLDKDLLEILNQTYEKTFSIKKGGKKYQKGYKLMYYAYKFLIVDPTGLKKKIYRWIDKWTPKKEGIYENYNSHITNINTSIFNLEHKLWYNPWDNTITSRESFFDLYEKAKKTCLTLFEATEQFMKDQITETEYKKVLQDKSYTTGFSWKIKKEMKYLEF